MVMQAVERYVKSAGATEYLTVSFARRLLIVNQGTLASATSTTAVLDEGASSSDDAYNSYRIRLLSGTGSTGNAVSYAATDYTGSTRTLTVASWQTTPDATTTYEIVDVLTGTPTITEQTTSDLTLSNKAVTTEITVDRDGDEIAAGQAVEFTAAGGTAGVTYTIRVSCSTVKGETAQLDVLMEVV